MRTRVITALLGLTLLLGLVVPGANAAACEAVHSPVATIVDLEVAETRLWVTDGRAIHRSDDQGCSWAEVFLLETGPLDDGRAIVELASPSGDLDWLSALTMAPSPVLPGHVVPRVLTTRDAGTSWMDVDEGLPDQIQMAQPTACDGRACGMVGTTDGDETLYLWWAEPSGTSVWWSLSGGRTFTVRSRPSNALNLEVRTDQPAQEMVVDDPGYFGLFGTRTSEGATASDDGGRTWNEWPEHFELFGGVEYGFPDEAVGQAADRQVDRLLVAELEPGSGALRATHVKYTGVLGWHRSEAPGVTGRVVGLTSAGDASLVALATTDGLFLGEQVSLAEIAWQAVSPATGDDLQFGAGLLWMHDGTDLFSVDPGAIPRLLDLPPVPTPPAELDLPPFDPANPYQPLPGTLAATDLVEVAPGEQVDLDLMLDVPAGDTPLDLAFLIARHDSMDDDLEALAREILFIVRDLTAAGVDVNVGVGVYGSQVRYHRYRDIGPPDDEFKAIVEDIYGFGPATSGYTALDAALAGTVYPQTGTKFRTFPGLEFHWRPNAVRAMVHVTDRALFTDEEGEPEEQGATIEQAHRAVVDAEVFHLGLVAPSDALLHPDTTRMAEVARVSGAVAPEPIDCNGDGVDDVQTGEGIVCPLPAGATNESVAGLGLLPGLSDVVIGLVEAASDLAPLAFHTTTPDLVIGLRAADGTTTIDLRAAAVVPALASVTCTTDLAGTTITSRISAVSRTRGLATTTFDIACGEQPTPPPPTIPRVAPAPAPEPVPATIAAPSPVAPAAAPVPISNPPPSTNVLPNQGIASAEQRETQAQAASIGKDQPRQSSDAEFAYTSLRRESDPAPLTLAVGGAMALGAAGALARRRVGTSQRVGVRR